MYIVSDATYDPEVTKEGERGHTQIRKEGALGSHPPFRDPGSSQPWVYKTWAVLSFNFSSSSHFLFSSFPLLPSSLPSHCPTLLSGSSTTHRDLADSLTTPEPLLSLPVAITLDLDGGSLDLPTFSLLRLEGGAGLGLRYLDRCRHESLENAD
ncbi:hypothetical protein M413DRAFT_26163 [Hebeloma cylindrosporum]|uniref:Uncharacterized protein n=1 Tax=Hebeloma cylindrosporum TaxID=76867 RepID=A0A0C3CIB7_HEBCY|nr:hypothetical protein M413DRAFT_26163 [Hebeloma cylindrosporum h7]